jgi:hypothetical protein
VLKEIIDPQMHGNQVPRLRLGEHYFRSEKELRMSVLEEPINKSFMYICHETRHQLVDMADLRKLLVAFEFEETGDLTLVLIQNQTLVLNDAGDQQDHLVVHDRGVRDPIRTLGALKSQYLLDLQLT